MAKHYLRYIAAGSLLLALSAGHPAWAQKRGGILRLASPGSPANMSIHESATTFTEMPMMGVFNNLIVFDQHKPQVSLETIVPDLATSWAWNKDDTALTFQLRQEVRWHDGMMASRSPPPMSSAPGTSCSISCRTSCGSTRARLDMRT